MIRKPVVIVSGVMLLLALPVLIMVLLSVTYDRSNPRDRPNSYYISNVVEIDRDEATVFQFIQYHLPDIYTELTDMHTSFDILNAAGLVAGAEIRCIEGDDNDVVHNHYIVTEVIENRLIQFESKPTIVYNRNNDKEVAKMNVHVYFDIERAGTRKTQLKQTIVIDMLNPLFKSVMDILAFITSGREEWKKQFRDELVNFKPIIERET